MEYNNIIKKLSQVTGMVQSWENQGFAPTIEKGIVLDYLKEIYAEFYDITATTGKKDYQTEYPKDQDSVAVENKDCNTEAEVTDSELETAIDVSATNDNSTKENTESENCSKTFFDTIPEGLKSSSIFELFDGSEEKAKNEINHLKCLESIDQLLIYIEEHYNWNPSSKTAIELIKFLSSQL